MSSLPDNPIEVLELPAHVRHALHRGNYRTVAALASLGEIGLRKKRYNLGLGSSEVRQILTSLETFFSAHQDASRPVPIEVLGLGTHAHNCLFYNDIMTVHQLAEMSDEQILELHGMGTVTFEEIREKLNAFLRKGSSKSSVWRSANSATDQAAAQLGLSGGSKAVTTDSLGPLKATSEQVRKDNRTSTPLAVLRLAARPYNCLRRHGITTVEQLAGFSDQELLAIKNLGTNSLSSIKESLRNYLESHPLEGIASGQANRSLKTRMSSSEKAKARSADFSGSTSRQVDIEPADPVLLHTRSATQSPDRALDVILADPEAFQAATEIGIPLQQIPVTRLGLARYITDMLTQLGIATVYDLATRSSASSTRLRRLKDRLDRYLVWLLDQSALAWEDEIAERGISPLHMADLRATSLDTLVDKWLSGLPVRDRNVVCWRYGIYGEIITLQAAAQRLGVTRERVRQLQGKSLRHLGHPSRRKVIAPLLSLLRYLVEQAGGFITEDQLDLALRTELEIGQANPVGVARLVFTIDGQFFFRRSVRAWEPAQETDSEDEMAVATSPLIADSQIGSADLGSGDRARPLQKDRRSRAEQIELRDGGPLGVSANSSILASEATSLSQLLDLWLSHLRPRAVAVVKSYYGLGQEARRISDIAAHLGVTPAGVTQVVRKAIRQLGELGQGAPLERCANTLAKAVESCGGIMPIEQAERELEQISSLGDHPASVWCRMIADADERIGWSPALSAVVSSDFDDGLVEEVQNGFCALVSQNGGEMLWDDAIFLFRNAPFIHEKVYALSDSAIIACVRADPRLGIEGESVRIQGAGRSHQLDRDDSGPTVRRETVADTIAAVLAESGSKLTVPEIISRVTARRPANETTIRVTLANSGRFMRVGWGVYALSDSIGKLE